MGYPTQPRVLALHSPPWLSVSFPSNPRYHVIVVLCSQSGWYTHAYMTKLTPIPHAMILGSLIVPLFLLIPLTSHAQGAAEGSQETGTIYAAEPEAELDSAYTSADGDGHDLYGSVVDAPWTRSYFRGLLGGLVSGVVAYGTVGLAFAFSFAGDTLTPLFTGLSLAPFIYALGPATGVSMHGRAHGGRGSYGMAFLGSLLGQLVASAPLILYAAESIDGAAPALCSIGIGLFISPLFASWGYWSHSNRRVEEDQARSSFQLMPTAYLTRDAGGLGVAGSF